MSVVGEGLLLARTLPLGKHYSMSQFPKPMACAACCSTLQHLHCCKHTLPPARPCTHSMYPAKTSTPALLCVCHPPVQRTTHTQMRLPCLISKPKGSRLLVVMT